MSSAAKETSQLASRRRPRRSKGQHHGKKRHAGEAAAVDDVSNEGVSDQLRGGHDERELVDQLENEDTRSSVSMQNILGQFLATKLQVIESENQRIPRSAIHDKRQKDRSHRSSGKRSRNKRSSDFSDLPVANDEFKCDKNGNDCWSDSKNPRCLDFWNDSERSSSCAMFDRTCVETVRGNHRQSRQSHGKLQQRRNEDWTTRAEMLHHGFRSSALPNHDGLERFNGNEAFPFSDVSLEYIPSLHKVKDDFRASGGESYHDPALEIAHEYQSEVHEEHIKSESHVHRSRRKRSFPKKSKETSEGRHKKSKRMRRKQDSDEVSTFVSPNFQTTSSNAQSASRCHQDSLYDDVSSISSESNDNDFGNFSSERHSGSRQKSSDYFQPGTTLCKPDNQMFKNRKQNADLKLNDSDIVGNETWAERYNRSKYFKRQRSHSGSLPAEADTDSLQFDKYSHLNTTDPIWGHSSKHNRLAYEGEVHMNCGDKSNVLSHSRNKTHSATKSPRSSSKKKSSRKVKSVKKHEKKHKHRDKSAAKSSHRHKPTKHKRRKTKNEDKVLAGSKVEVEIAKPCVLPSNEDADDNFRPMMIAVENNDDIADLFLGKRTADDTREQCSALQLDYNAVVACAEKISVPSRIVKTYKDGIAVSRLLRRVKTRMAPLRLADISRLQATLPRHHPVVTIEKSSQQKSANIDQVENSTVVQDVEDPGVQRQDQPQTCGILPTISDATGDHTSDDILQPLGVLCESTVVQAGPVDYLALTADTSVNVESSDPNHQDQLLGQTVASQVSVQLHPLPEYSQTLKQDVEVETSVDPITTVETVTATVEPCLRLSSESEVTVTGSVETTVQSKSHASDSLQDESTPDVAPAFPVSATSVQTISVESSNSLTLHVAVQLLDNSCMQHSSDGNECAVADEMQSNLSSNCDIIPELTCVSCCSDGNSQNVGSNEVTAIISPNKEMSSEDVVDSIADHSVSHVTISAEETGHTSDTCQQDEVSKSRQNQMQCVTLVVSDIVGMRTETTGIEESRVPDKEMTGKEEPDNDSIVNEVHEIKVNEKEVTEKEVTEKEVCDNDLKGSEVAEKEVAEKEVCDNDSGGSEVAEKEVTEKEVSEKEVYDNDARGSEVSEKEVTGKEVTEKEFCDNDARGSEVAEKEVTGKEVTEKEVCDNDSTGSEVVGVEVERHCTEKKMNPENEEVMNEGLFCETEVGHTEEISLVSSQSLSAEQSIASAQTLKADSLIKFVKAGCSEISRDAELCFRPPKSPEPREDCKTVWKTSKKLSRNMGIKISGWSAAFISSGTRYENDPKKRNREEGELTDSSADSSESESVEPAPVEQGTVECIPGLESSGSMSVSTEGEIEEPVAKPKSKQRKKHKRKHKKHKKQKRRHSIELSFDEEESRSRSRGRSFSVARTFDGERGVWREKKPKHRRKKVPVKNRPRLNIDKEKLREIAIKNSLHSRMSFNRSTMKKLSEMTEARPGGKTVAELTDFCKTISGRLDYSTSSSEDENGQDVRRRAMDDSLDDESVAFMSNFMKSRDKDARIVLNIRDSRQLPALSAQEMMAKKAVMRLMFPVSNGAQHRRSEEGWVPVTKPDPLPRPQVPTTDPPLQTITIPSVPPTSAGMAAVELATARAPVVEDPFLAPLPPNADVSVIIKERLAAIKRLHENPTDEQAMGDVVRAQMQMQQWAEAKQIPGQFFSSVLRMGLMGNKLKKHDWLRRTKQNPESDAAAGASQIDASGGNDGVTTFASTLDTPVGTGPDRTYNIGKLMMLRMGWKESEGLGRQNLGRLTPLSLNMKKDRRGLQAREETIRPVAQVLSVKGKHPVSALLESCMRRRIGQPEFVLIDETGPAHSKRFLYKVILNGVEYQPNVGSNNKKTAKLQAAACCLDALGFSGGSK